MKIKKQRLIERNISAFINEKILSKFWSCVDKTNKCWLWNGSKNPKGYGLLWINRNMYLMAHRFSYSLIKKIPEGLQLDHICRIHNCVNPMHLEPVTQKQNILRGVGITAENAKKKYCKRGHRLIGNNLKMNGNYRNCRACIKIRQLQAALAKLDELERE